MEEETLRRLAAELKLHIAIDGPAGAGKSTVGEGLARALGCAYLDTGLMYRAITWMALKEGIPLSDAVALAELADRANFSLSPNGRLLVNGVPAGDELRVPEVDAGVSEVSAHPEVRSRLVARQRALAEGRCIVMVGRDIGTTVLPDAPIKLWVTASIEERARRRFSERIPGAPPDDAEVLRRMRERDAYDSARPASPLRRADHAVDIHTDGVSPGQALEEALTVVAATVGRLRAAAS